MLINFTSSILDFSSFEIFFILLQHTFRCVIHFAALKAVGESCQKPLEYYKANVSGTINLLEAMRENNVKHFICSSSATVNGVPEQLPLVEDMKTGNCTNPYGKTKFMVEEILKDLCASDKVHIIVYCFMIRFNEKLFFRNFPLYL